MTHVPEDIDALPARGEVIQTSEGQARLPDKRLLSVLDALNDEYGWVSVLLVLWRGVISRYPAGRRYAHHLTGREPSS